MYRNFNKENNEKTPAIAYELNCPIGFVKITDNEQIKTLFISKYKERKEDGITYISDFASTRYIEILTGKYTSFEVFALEAHLKNVHNDLNNGWWLTANQNNLILPLSGIYDNEMKDIISLAINEYIIKNY